MLRRARAADSQFEIIGPQRIPEGRFARVWLTYSAVTVV
jgi:hypothetical protein